MVNIIIWTILIIPWVFIPMNGFLDPERMAKEIVFDIAMMAIIFYAIKDGLKFEYKNKYLAWFSGLVFFSFVFNWYYPFLMQYGFNGGTIVESIHFILALIASYFVLSSLTRDDFIRISKAVCYSAMAVSIFAILQFIGLDPMRGIAKITMKSTETRHWVALLDSPDLISGYLVLSLPFFYYLRGIRYTLGVLLVLFVIFINHSSLAIVSSVISMCVYFILSYGRKKFVKEGILIFFIFFGVFCFMNHSFSKIDGGFSGRIQAWGEFLRKDHNILFGNGLGIAKSYQVKFLNNYWYNCHNDYIQIFLQVGFVGLFVFVSFVGDILKRFRYKPDNFLSYSYLSCFISFLILMIGSFPMESAPLALGGLISWWGLEKTGV